MSYIKYEDIEECPCGVIFAFSAPGENVLRSPELTAMQVALWLKEVREHKDNCPVARQIRKKFELTEGDYE